MSRYAQTYGGTSLYPSSFCGTLHCTDAKDFEKINPLVTGQGSFPPIQAIYEHTRGDGIETPWDGKADYTALGRRILQDMESEEGTREVVKIEYGDEIGSSLATPGQMHKYPAKSWRSLERYLLARRKPETIMSRKKFKKLQKKTRAWLKEAHAMYSTLIDRLSSDGLHTLLLARIVLSRALLTCPHMRCKV